MKAIPGLPEAQANRLGAIAPTTDGGILQDEAEFAATPLRIHAFELEAADDPRAEKDAILGVIRAKTIIIIMIGAGNHLVGIDKGMRVEGGVGLIIPEEGVVFFFGMRAKGDGESFLRQRFLDLPFHKDYN